MCNGWNQRVNYILLIEKNISSWTSSLFHLLVPDLAVVIEKFAYVVLCSFHLYLLSMLTVITFCSWLLYLVMNENSVYAIYLNYNHCLLFSVYFCMWERFEADLICLFAFINNKSKLRFSELHVDARFDHCGYLYKLFLFSRV